MANVTRKKPYASGASSAPHSGAVISSLTAAVGAISRARRCHPPLPALAEGCLLGRGDSMERASTAVTQILSRGLGLEPQGHHSTGQARSRGPCHLVHVSVGALPSGGGQRLCYTQGRQPPGSSSAWQSTTFGTWGSEVQILSPRLHFAVPRRHDPPPETLE